MVTIIERIHALADRPANEACAVAATVLRKLASEDGALQKAHSIVSALRKQDTAVQTAILAAAEALCAAKSTRA